MFGNPVSQTGPVIIEKKYMVKEGDDLRQDQLILQLFNLFDQILKRYGMDLKLSPYKVIA